MTAAKAAAAISHVRVSRDLGDQPYAATAMAGIVTAVSFVQSAATNAPAAVKATRGLLVPGRRDRKSRQKVVVSTSGSATTQDTASTDVGNVMNTAAAAIPYRQGNRIWMRRRTPVRH